MLSPTTARADRAIAGAPSEQNDRMAQTSLRAVARRLEDRGLGASGAGTARRAGLAAAAGRVSAAAGRSALGTCSTVSRVLYYCS